MHVMEVHIRVLLATTYDKVCEYEILENKKKKIYNITWNRFLDTSVQSFICF